MNKNKIIAIVAVILIIIGVGTYFKKDSPQLLIQKKLDPKDLEVTIEGHKAQYFGNEAYGDLNGDKLEDIAFLVTYDGGGSGTFYYAVVSLQTVDGYKLTNPFLIGDRIAPQSTYIPINSREVQINYAERKPGEPMTTPPSQGATLLLKVNKDGVLEGLMK